MSEVSKMLSITARESKAETALLEVAQINTSCHAQKDSLK
jgi:hypothetical protein